jgi:hypothetical protein
VILASDRRQARFPAAVNQPSGGTEVEFDWLDAPLWIAGALLVLEAAR